MDVNEYIESGILELYVLGQLSEEENSQVKAMSEKHEEIRKEIENIENALSGYASATGINVDPTAKPMLLASIDYTSRIKQGEALSYPPLLSENSLVSDYEEWLKRPDMVQPADADNIFLKIIGYTTEVTTAIVWVKEFTPSEIHHREFERFLIIEGTCEISIEGKVQQLKAGSYLEIPLHAEHHVKVTSSVNCKIILQRVAA